MAPMGRTVVALAFALAAGGVVGYMVGAARAPVPARAGRALAPVPSPEPVPAFQAEPASDLGRALREVPTAAPPREGGAITGGVHDERGAPVAGVLVVATPDPEQLWLWPPPRSARPPDPPDLEREVRAFVEEFHRRRLGRAEATTGSDGAYVLAQLSDVPHTVRAYLDGHVVEPVGGSAYAVRPGGLVDFVAQEAVRVDVDVVFPDGTRPPDAGIRLGKDTCRWTPSEPALLLPPGAYVFSAELPGDEGWLSKEVAREVVRGAAVEPVVLRLEGRNGIRGQVRLAPGDRFPYVAVRALRFAGDRTPTLEELANSDKSHWDSGEGGYRYRFLDLEPGRYLVGVDIGEETIVATKIVEVSTSIVECDFDVPRVDPRAYLIVRVFTPDGQPLSNVQLQTGVLAGGGGSSGSTNFVRRPDGSLLVLHQSGYRDEADATYFVTAISETYGAKQASYKLGERNEVEIRFGEPATAEVTLQGYDDTRLAGALEVEAYPGGVRAWHHHSAEYEVDSDGRVALGPIEAGPCEVVVRVKTDKWRTVELVRETLRLSPGRNAVTLALPPLYGLTVLADPGTELELVRLERHEDEVASGTAGADGRIAFRRLRAGRYEVRGPGKGAMGLVLPGLAEVTWRPQQANALIALVYRADGPLAALGLEDGDFVVAIDGAVIAGQDDGRRLLAVALGREEATLAVARGARTFELKVGGKALAAALDGGGDSLHPTVR
jgi:hypothetical protein